ncbi:sulfotransferase [Thermoactinospora rubra]|uniref:sulfotransferase n=1 Tax=Thermoactinospora rubra TaxID=1088767 RepID=UPI000A115CE8|nr:sulfotransferase [Thermoactinospora rubra]
MTAPLLLLGAQRSGTTALAHALSRAYAGAGGLFTVNGKLPYLLPRWCTEADLRGRHFRADEILHALARKPPGGEGSDRWLAHVEQVLRRVAAEVAQGYGGAAPSLVARVIADSYAPWPLWGDKYNEYLMDLPALLAAVPSARLVLLVRHPEAVAESVLRWPGDRPWKPVTRPGAYAKWAAWHRGWLELAGGLAEERLMVVGYHALCAGKATRRLSEFTGLDLAPYLTGLRPSGRDDYETPDEVADVWRTLCEMECDR